MTFIGYLKLFFSFAKFVYGWFKAVRYFQRNIEPFLTKNIGREKRKKNNMHPVIIIAVVVLGTLILNLTLLNRSDNLEINRITKELAQVQTQYNRLLHDYTEQSKVLTSITTKSTSDINDIHALRVHISAIEAENVQLRKQADIAVAEAHAALEKYRVLLSKDAIVDEETHGRNERLHNFVNEITKASEAANNS